MNKQGKITPSGFSDMMTGGRNGQKFGATAHTYAQRIALERLGVELPEVNAWAMQHGNMYEPDAIALYEERTGLFVEPCGTIDHPELVNVSGTPDGLIGQDGIVEIKCPYNPVNHLANLRCGEQIAEYKWQIQGYLWITGRKWCDFVSYDPRFPDALKLYVERVERDDMMVMELAERVREFEGIVQSYMIQP